MEEIRLYRQIYCVVSDIYTSIDTYNLFDPFFISASTKNINSSSIIEIPSVIQESTGVYYVSLNPELYTFSEIYEVNWFVNYINPSPQKRLPTRFKINPVNISSGLDLEISNSNAIEVEIVSTGT